MVCICLWGAERGGRSVLHYVHRMLATDQGWQLWKTKPLGLPPFSDYLDSARQRIEQSHGVRVDEAEV